MAVAKKKKTRIKKAKEAISKLKEAIRLLEQAGYDHSLWSEIDMIGEELADLDYCDED